MTRILIGLAAKASSDENNRTTEMLKDIDEDQAKGEIAAIYAEIRDLWGVPYVSAVHRHMASRPGLLEWAWEAVGPAFRNGQAQAAAETATGDLEVAELDKIDANVLKLWQVEPIGEATARTVADNFVRVAPTNMMFAALLQRVIREGVAIEPSETETVWHRPPPLPPLPTMVEIDALDDAGRAVIMRFAAQMDAKPFVPGLYRMLAHWPGLLAHLATVLPAVLDSRRTALAYDDIRQRIDDAAAGFAMTRPVSGLERSKPSEVELSRFQAIAKTYRITSPEMIVAGGLISRALAAIPS